MPASPTARPPAEAPGRRHRALSRRSPAARAESAAGQPAESAEEVVRWAAFSCLLVPVVLTVYGTSFVGAVAAALGLAAVTAVCRLLLRHSERAAAELRSEELRAAELRAEELRAAELRAAELRAEEARAAGARAGERSAPGREEAGRTDGSLSPPGP